jgi:hypothetical protein
MRALGKGSLASIIKVVLDIAWVVLWVCAGSLALGVVGYLGLIVCIEMGLISPDFLEGGRSSVEVGAVTVETANNDRLVLHVVAPAMLSACVAVGGALIIVLGLKRLFKNFTSGEPFSRDNASHLRIIWITMLVMELSRYAIASAVAIFVTVFGQPETTTINVQAPVNFMTWCAIFVLIVLAEVFREGARLKEEQELTI